MALIRLSPLQFDLADAPYNFPSADGVNALSLAANVAETLTIPAGAHLVKINGTADFYLKANAVATVPGDTVDGTAAELVKYNGGTDTWRTLSGVTSLSLITPVVGGAVVTASFYVL